MNILVTGATGFIGRPLCKALADDGHQVTALTRSVDRARQVLGESIRCEAWSGSGERPEAWWPLVTDVDAVVHLAGAPVAEKSWTAEVKRELVRSRVESTNGIVNAIRAAERKPSVLVCASGINYYGDAGEQTLTESAPPGSSFLAELAVAWEQAAAQAEQYEVRVVRLRTGIVLERGGPLDKILNPLPVPISPWRLGLGGPIGSGKQWFPWIHLTDMVHLYTWSILNGSVSGPVNAVAPQLIRNVDFSRALGRVLHRPAVFPVPRFVLHAIAGDFAEELTTSHKAVPAVAQQLGFEFKFKTIDEALRAILSA